MPKRPWYAAQNNGVRPRTGRFGSWGRCLGLGFKGTIRAPTMDLQGYQKVQGFREVQGFRVEGFRAWA